MGLIRDSKGVPLLSHAKIHKMSLTPSNMMPLGSIAPDFKLLNTISDKYLMLSDLKSEKATVIMFICNHCPYVIHIQEQLISIANSYRNKGVSFVAISSNDAEHYPDDSPLLMKAEAQNKNYPFPYLYDESQEVAKAYLAACTPDFYIFDKELQCVYRGRMDDSTPGNGKENTGIDLRNALDSLLDNRGIVAEQFPSIGCNIKWKV